MILNENYKIAKYGDVVHLVNIDSGDIYRINEVTETIIQLVDEQRELNDIIKITYEKYKDENESFTDENLRQFIFRLQEEGIIRK